MKVNDKNFIFSTYVDFNESNYIHSFVISVGALGAFAPMFFGKIHKICTNLSKEEICNYGFRFLNASVSDICDM